MADRTHNDEPSAAHAGSPAGTSTREQTAQQASQQAAQMPSGARHPRILLQGVGGIGGVLSAHWLEAGLDPVLVTGNPDIAGALNRHGVRVKGPGGAAERTVRLRTPASAGVLEPSEPFDYIFLATPPPRLEDALRASRHLLAPGGAVVCMQNGLPEDRAMTLVNPEQVLGCVVAWGASMPAPGQYEQTSTGYFQLGVPDGGSRPQLEGAAALLSHMAPARVTTNLQGVRWSKLAINCATATLGALGGDRLGNLLLHRFVRRLALEIFTELLAVADASQVKLEKVMGTLDIRQVALREQDRKATLGSPGLLFRHALLLAVGARFRRLRSSMLYQLERGRPSGVEFLNGELVRRGALLGVQTPVNSALVQALRQVESKDRVSSLQTLRAVAEELGLT